MRVHRNLHNARRGGPQWIETRGGRKVAELDSVLLVDVSTRIQPAGQRKCETSGVRSVCAFFDGAPGDSAVFDATGDVDVTAPGWYRVSFDPRSDDRFYATGKGGVRYSWNRAAAAILRHDGSTWALNPTWEA